jgi:hypothetical protein
MSSWNCGKRSWSSMAQLQAAHDAGFRELVDQPAWSAFEPHPFLYEVVHEGQAETGSVVGAYRSLPPASGSYPRRCRPPGAFKARQGFPRRRNHAGSLSEAARQVWLGRDENIRPGHFRQSREKRAAGACANESVRLASADRIPRDQRLTPGWLTNPDSVQVLLTDLNATSATADGRIETFSRKAGDVRGGPPPSTQEDFGR